MGDCFPSQEGKYTGRLSNSRQKNWTLLCVKNGAFVLTVTEGLPTHVQESLRSLRAIEIYRGDSNDGLYEYFVLVRTIECASPFIEYL